MWFRGVQAGIVLFLFVASCFFVGTCHGYTVTTVDGPVMVQNFGYQLQGVDTAGNELAPEPLAAASHDLLVIDFARYGDEASKFTPAEVEQMQQSTIALGGDGKRKVVTAYVSIGEASEFRSFWNPSWTQSGEANSPLSPSAPGWLGPTNTNWPESRKVRYWDTNWQDLVYNNSGSGWLDQVVTQGFDGAYLDIVDAYHYWGSEVGASDQVPGDPQDDQEAARRMIDFVVAMTTHARQTNPSFFVIPQNGEFILSDLQFGPNPQTGDSQRLADYLDAIGAIGIEDTYYRGNQDENNVLNPDNAKITVLQDDFLAAGKPVLVVDYVNQLPKVDDFTQRARTDGFLPYAAPNRGLDTLSPAAADPLPGDFDGDGDVDPADYGRWLTTFGSSLLLASDANNNGKVDAADYTLWRDHLTAAVTTIPEPVASSLMVSALMLPWHTLGSWHTEGFFRYRRTREQS